MLTRKYQEVHVHFTGQFRCLQAVAELERKPKLVTQYLVNTVKVMFFCLKRY
jgi:hypothetical protein